MRRPRTEKDEADFASMSEAVRRLRRERDLTQASLAQRAGVSIRGLRELEGGQVETHWGTLRRIAKGLEVRLEDLIEAAEESPERDSNS